MKKIRTLTAGEIECRVGQCGKGARGGWCSLLLYKDARCDMKLMDETFGAMNWQKSYTTINGNLYCTVSVRDENGEWISRQDVGTESNTEKEKGAASDAYKRACVNWGIGRELYTAPKIFINLADNEIQVKTNGSCALSSKVIFSVQEIGYDENRCINSLVIVDNNGNVRYKLGQQMSAPKVQTQNVDDEQLHAFALPAIQQATTQEELKRIWNDFPSLQDNPTFKGALSARKKEILPAA